LAMFVTRRHPDGSCVRRFSPIPRVPAVASSNGIPVAIHPHIGRLRPHRTNHHNARRWRRPNRDSDGNLRANTRNRRAQQCNQQARFDKRSHMFTLPPLSYPQNDAPHQPPQSAIAKDTSGPRYRSFASNRTPTRRMAPRTTPTPRRRALRWKRRPSGLRKARRREAPSLYESPNRTSKRDSSAPYPGAPRKTKSAGHYARNDAPPLPLPS
jgi:hypothetical protein